MNVYGLYVCVFRSEVEEGRCQYGDWHVICAASDITEYDRITPELSNAPPHMKKDTTSIEKYPLKPKSIFDWTYAYPWV